MANKFVENICSSDQTIYCVDSNHTPHYNPNNTRPMDGVVRTAQGGLEYYDAGFNAWLPLPGSEIRVELSPHVTRVVDWAYRKMEEELKFDVAAAKYPAFARARENFELMKAMVRNEVA
jgi:hypothetical protein